MYDNLARPGLRTTTSPSPKSVLEDISEKVRTLEPESTPLITLSQYIKRGKPPTNHKIQQMKHYAFDDLDHVSSVVDGGGIADAWRRFARFTVDHISRPNTRDSMIYYPQDTLYIHETGQEVEVVCTPVAAKFLNDSGSATIVLPDTLTGNSTTRTAEGTIVVRTVGNVPFIPFEQSYITYMARTIAESQPIQGEALQEDIIYTCNFVEHKEAVVKMTKDQYKMAKLRGIVPDFNFQQTNAFRRIRRAVEKMCFMGTKDADFTRGDRATRYTEGLLPSIKTNVSYYNPNTVQDFELLVLNHVYDTVFRYGSSTKIGFAGPAFLKNFNLAFREYRRTSNLDVGGKVGLNFDTYQIGPFVLKLTRNEIFRQESPMSNWLVVMDPQQAEFRIEEDFTSRMYANNDERDIKLVIEWKGAIAWHMEETNSLLRT